MGSEMCIRDSSDGEGTSDYKRKKKHKKKSLKHKKRHASSESDSDSGGATRSKYTDSKYFVSYKEMM